MTGEFFDRRKEQLEREGLKIPAELAVQFAALDREQIESDLWRVAVTLAAICRREGGHVDVDLDAIRDPRNRDGTIAFEVLDGVLRVTVESDPDGR